ncbi:phage regulatory CII family protein [Aquipseudomonas alcaligenes]|uniref:phage regulatory CII family protein n=1 Tax=Aquipseudomonas alcaligenes TaxID=43263 RepID=UPI0007800041|nr:phage regulatory CII family protein [Pseudomonas alcaligenes]AMR66740.1 Rha family transcriptional regulator [Pseudomonas alcaligenes]
MEQFLRACHDAVKDAEPKRLASQMGLPHVSLLQRANPDNDAHKLTINHLYQILLHTQDMRPLAALVAEFGFTLVAKEGAEAVNLSVAVLHMHAEVADVTKAVTAALDDGRVSQMEKAMIRREITGVRESLDVLEASVQVA